MLLVNPMNSTLSINRSSDHHLMIQQPVLSNVSTKTNTPEESFCDDIFDMDMDRFENKSYNNFLQENAKQNIKENLEIE